MVQNVECFTLEVKHYTYAEFQKQDLSFLGFGQVDCQLQGC